MKKLYSASIESILYAIKSRALVAMYAKNSHPKTYNWNWGEKNFNRIALINFLLSKKRGWDTNYLEIGCADNHLFDSVASNSKTGVDPESGGTERMTSDEFFKKNKKKFDVIFVDGLHHYDQVHRDAINAVEALSDGGWVAFHDFLPGNWREHHVPRLQSAWNGDCWKVAIELSAAEGIEFRIVEIDHGVGLARKAGKKINIPNMGNELSSAQFDIFVDNIGKLPIISFEEAVDFINSFDSV